MHWRLALVVHEAGFYGDDQAFTELVVPFLLEGVEQGEPTMLALDDEHLRLVEPHVDLRAFHEVVPAVDRYRTPALALLDHQTRFSDLLRDGASWIRTVGDVPHTGTGGSWDGWSRYESAVNAAFADLPVRKLCPYDLRVTPDDVAHDVRCTHAFERHAGRESSRSAIFADPSVFLAARPPPPPHPLQSRAPDLVLDDPAPIDARAAIGALGIGLVNVATLNDAIIAVSEVVANAWRHGAPPVRLEAWGARGTLVVVVRDHGEGAADPLVGLLPQQPTAGTLPSGGVGLWIAGQVCADLVLHRGSAHEVRLVLVDPTA